ncbi:unnamed protein product [Symbiodinium sp. CCMP2592]|nr:unnamed protein product [Symbiodinium sp. CCMP2592]
MAQTGEVRLASSVLERASAWRIELDYRVYIDLLKGCQRGADDVATVSLLQDIRESQVTPDVSMYEAMAAAVSRRRCTRIQSAISSQPARKKDLVRVAEEQISQQFEEMLSTVAGNLENISELRRALILLAKTGRLERAEAFFAEVRRSLPEDVADDAMAAPYAAAGRCQEASRYGTRSLVGLRAAMEGFLQGGEPQKALQLLSAAREQQLPADPLACETAVKCCRAVGQNSWLRRLCTESYQALGQLMESQVPAEQQYEAFRACARAWALSGQWSFALQLLNTIDRDQWGVRSQSTMVQACLETGAAAEAEQLFNSMLERGEEPEVLACHAMMLQYTRAEDETKADELYKSAVRGGLCPDWFLRKNSMSVVGLSEELAAFALRIFLEKLKIRCLKMRRVTHDVLIMTSPQAGVESLREWTPAKSEEKKMQQCLSNLLRKEYSLEVVRVPGGLTLLKLSLQRYLGLGGQAKRVRTTVMEKAHQLAYRPPSTEEFD